LSNKFTVKRSAILQKYKRIEDNKKQKGSIKTIATFKAQVKRGNNYKK